MTKKLKPWIVPSTGETIQTFPLSQISMTLQVKRRTPEPKAPLIEVTIAGTKTVERNYADPDYARSVQKWEGMVNLEVVNQTLLRLASKQVLTDEQQAEVQELRSEMNGAFDGVSDKFVWLTEIALGNDQDLEALIKFISGQADPQEERIEEKAKNFRGKAEG